MSEFKVRKYTIMCPRFAAECDCALVVVNKLLAKLRIVT
jgi:hypothetical protein